MKKVIINSLFSLLAISGLWACKETWLEEPPRGFLSEDVLANEAGINAALIGSYSLLDGMNIDGANTWSANPHNFIFGSIPTDDAYKGTEPTDFPEASLLEIYDWTPNNSMIEDKWRQNYEGIVRANSVMNLLGIATDLTPEFRSRIEGEARFLRAYYHFELYKVWGNVPYYTEEDTEFVKSNVGVDPLGDAIKDLEEAIKLLPETPHSDRGRVSQRAARAFLGKLYLYGDTKDPVKAKQQLDLVVNGDVNLAPCLKDIFSTENDTHEESLFAVQASMGDGQNNRNANWLNQLSHPHAGSPFGCCGVHQPSQDLVNAFKVDANGLPMFDNYYVADLDPATDFVDPRLDLTVGRDNVPFLDWGVHAPTWIRDRSYGGPYSAKKHIHYTTDAKGSGGWNNNAYSTINYHIMRLADAILFLAEAEVMLDNLERAEELVNMVRERAGNCAQGPLSEGVTGSAVITDDIADPAITWANYKVSPYPVGTFRASGADYAMNAVRWERRLELALEGHRMFDLRRYGMDYAAQILNTFVERSKGSRTYYKDAAQFGERHRWFPIPLNQIQTGTLKGEQLIQQNPGY